MIIDILIWVSQMLSFVAISVVIMLKDKMAGLAGLGFLVALSFLPVLYVSDDTFKKTSDHKRAIEKRR